jgi:hypothetical protein
MAMSAADSEPSNFVTCQSEDGARMAAAIKGAKGKRLR